jgi:RpiR family transcriptional regulator, carbohydrate utilization regulator
MANIVTGAASHLSGATPPVCLLKLRAMVHSLPDHHARIAHFAMSNPAEFLELDAREIGYQCSTSEATVVRFCQRIGYRGLSEMKRVLGSELAANLSSSTAGRFDRASPVLERVFSSCAEALRDTLSGTDRSKIDSIATAIARSERLYLFGAGGSAHIAQVAALNFLSLGFQIVAFVDPMQQHAAAKLATPRDVIIAVTYSGNQADLAETLKAARKRGGLCVAITSFEQSLIAKSAQEILLMFIPPETWRGQAGAHRVAQIALLDTLAVRATEIRTQIATKNPRMKVKLRDSKLLVKGSR